MRILIGHNHYQQFGGEDAAVGLEIELLRSRGHEVLLVEMSNKDFNRLSLPRKIKNILSWDFSPESYQLIKRKCQEFRPDIAHFHNTFFMMTPGVYDACRELDVPLVQTLHNFRLLCSNALFFRHGRPCEECLTFSLRRGIRYGCYHGSRWLTWAVVRMLEKHWKKRTWGLKIDALIVFSDFFRQKLIMAGIPAENIWIKPNFIFPDPGVRQNYQPYFVFAGRLSEEKGLRVLLEAFKHLPEVKLIIMGDGPLKKEAIGFIKRHKLFNIELKGFLQEEAYWSMIKAATAVIVPSICYENFPMLMVEAFACGVPVIASRLGSMQTIVEDKKTGMLFKACDADDLAEKVRQLVSNGDLVRTLGLKAREEYLGKYTSECNYQQLRKVYESAICKKSKI